MGGRGGGRHALRASALATVLAGALALAAPGAAGLIGAAEAAGPARGGEAAPTRDLRPTGAVALAERGVAARRAATARADDAVEAPADPAPMPSLLVHVPPGGLVARRAPRAGAPIVGRVADRSRYYGVPTVAWVEEIRRGSWGRVELPYVWPRREGWVRLGGLRRETTWVRVHADLSAHRLTVLRRDEVILRAPAATGAPGSPTPPGDYAVTDRVPFARGSYLGSFAFGISGIQPRLPAGWTGGDQLAIHGTDAPWTIGTSASAGCVRVGERVLDRLKPLLRLGTPVTIVP
ncbi:MAG TPA: L,D-transpeptidase [Actinomycetota bacterium]